MIAIVKGNICDVYEKNFFSCTSIVLAFDLILLFDSISKFLESLSTKNALSFFVNSTCYVYIQHMVVKKREISPCDPPIGWLGTIGKIV